MTDSSRLLRMLEPTVRPVATPQRGSAQPAGTPIEQRSFESLLAEADGSAEGDEAAPGEARSAAAGGWNPLASLARVDAIENASLRAIMGHAGAAED
ncbi:MAG: hypothetical protein WD118_09350 [Phycisphaeraceae bacterium]